MRAVLLLPALALLGGCEALRMQAEQAEAKAQETAQVAAAAIETGIPGCSTGMAPRWSVAINGEPSFIANLVTKQNETRALPLVVEEMNPTRVKFGYIADPLKSANMSTINASVAQLPSGVCGMQGKFQRFPESAERAVVMVPLQAARYVQ